MADVHAVAAKIERLSPADMWRVAADLLDRGQIRSARIVAQIAIYDLDTAEFLAERAQKAKG